MSQVFYLGSLFLAHATCSVSMVLLNKTITQGLDFPWTIVFVQNVGTMIISYLHSCLCGRSEQKKADLKEASPDDALPAGRTIMGIKVPRKMRNKVLVMLQVMFFMGSLFTSLKALRFISVPLYVVARNTVPAQTALLERIFSSVRISASAALGLVLTILGAVLYTFGDLKTGLALGGLAYAWLLTMIVASCSVIDKTAVRALSQEEGISAVEVNQIRVSLALPINLLFVVLFDLNYLSFGPAAGENPAAATLPQKSPELLEALATASNVVLICLLVSMLFGFGMGVFNFALQQVVSAATVQVANILYKLTTTLISLVTHPTPVTPLSWLGYSISLTGIALYTFAPRIPFSCCRNAREEGKEK